jgi:hypothetical protein
MRYISGKNVFKIKLLVEDTTTLNTHDNGLKREKRSQLLMSLEEEVCQILNV